MYFPLSDEKYFKLGIYYKNLICIFNYIKSSNNFIYTYLLIMKLQKYKIIIKILIILHDIQDTSVGMIDAMCHCEERSDVEISTVQNVILIKLILTKQ